MKPKILVVDDSLTIRRALEMILEDREFELRLAASGQEGLEEAARFDPDLVLLDYVLPDMRGPDVCAALEEIAVTRHTPVVLVSAKGASIRQAYQDARNVVSYITKPFKPAVVLTVVGNVLRDHPRRASGDQAHPSASPPARGRLDSLEEGFQTLLGQLEESAQGFREESGGCRLEPAQLLAAVADRTADLAGAHESAAAPLSVAPDGTILEIRERLLLAHRSLADAILQMAGAPADPREAPPALLLVGGDAVDGELPAGTWPIAADDPMLPHLTALLQPARIVFPARRPGEENSCADEFRERCTGHAGIEVETLPAEAEEWTGSPGEVPPRIAEEDGWEVVCL